MCVRVSVRQTAVCCCTQTAGWRKTALLAVYASENCCLFLWWPAVTLIALTWRISALFIVWSGQNEMLFMCLHFCHGCLLFYHSWCYFLVLFIYDCIYLYFKLAFYFSLSFRDFVMCFCLFFNLILVTLLLWLKLKNAYYKYCFGK